jgi:hypothetical protein
MISTQEGLRILRRWKSKRTSLVFFFDVEDFVSWQDAQIFEVRSKRLTVELSGRGPDRRSLDLEGAEFHKADGPELLIRLRDGTPVLFGGPAPIIQRG